MHLKQLVKIFFRFALLQSTQKYSLVTWPVWEGAGRRKKGLEPMFWCKQWFKGDCSHAAQTQLSPARLLNRTTHSYCWRVLIILLGQALRMGVSEASKGVKDKPLWCLSGISAPKFPRHCEKPLCFIFFTPFRICGRKAASSTFFCEIRIILEYFLKENLSVATALFQPIESYRFLCGEAGKSRDKQRDALGWGSFYGLMRYLLL